MKDNIKELDIENELSPEGSEAIDRLLSDFARSENSEVDYGSMLASIKSKARSEGISVFAPVKKRRNTVKRVLTGVGAAAAVFVIGLAAFAVIRTLPFPGMNSHSAALEPGGAGDKVVESGDSSHGNVLPDPGKTGVDTKTETKDPSGVAEPVSTAMPDFIDDEAPLPTIVPIRGGIMGYVRLTDFLADPVYSAQLVPDFLPEFMELKLGEAELYASAYGVEDKTEYLYTCRVVEAPEEGFDIGVARFTEKETGELTYLWHVSEDVYIEVEFTGFDREAAEELLLSIVLCNTEDILPYTPAPTEEAA